MFMIVYNCFCRFVVPLAVTVAVCGYEFDVLISILLSAAKDDHITLGSGS